MWVMLAEPHASSRALLPSAFLRRFAESVDRGTITLGYVLSQRGWQLTRHSLQHAVALQALLSVAACDCQLQGCIGGRLGCGARVLEGHNGIDDSLLLWWPAGKPREMSWQQLPGTAKLVTADVFGVDWRSVAFVQFLLVGGEEVRTIRVQAPHAPLMLGGDQRTSPGRTGQLLGTTGLGSPSRLQGCLLSRAL